MGFKERYERTVAEAAACCEACGRDPKSVVVVAVSKTVGADEVAEAIEAGAHDFGENRPDSLEGKRARFPQQTWHFIGNIQSRRIPDIVRDAALVHSLYQQRHVPKFDAAAAASGKVQDVLLEVNVSGEASKSGLAPSEVAGMLEYCAGFPHVRVRGLMTMRRRAMRNGLAHASPIWRVCATKCGLGSTGNRPPYSMSFLWA